jgi:pyruvate,water dikinase
MARRAWKDAVPLARDAVALGEDDDHLFARLQAAVRRALLALGGRLVAAGAIDAAADVFLLPLDRIRALASASPSLPGGPASDLRELVRAARALWAIQREAPPPAPADVEGPVRGHGTGGRAIGRVVHAGEILTARASDPAAPPAAGQALVASAMTDAVLVATTILPTLLPLLAPAALVVETGGPLDHVAAQARERGLPAVVGAAGAPRRLPPGTLVLVDADAGVVIPLAHPSARV